VTTAEVPDDLGLRDALAPGLLDHAAPRKLGVGKVIPARELERLERATKRRSEVLLGAQHRSQYLELLIGQLDDPHLPAFRRCVEPG
jgi:hypothetical protein